MKILFTGGGTAGHFYPLIAVAEAIRDVTKEEKLIDPQLFYAGPVPFDQDALFMNDILFVKTSAGKVRRYFSLMNIVDFFKTAWGVTVSIFRIFFLYPDVIFSKGGYASFPTLLAARLFRIPVVIHESDTVPGRVSLWSGKFATKIAVSYAHAAQYFPKDKVAVTGNPIRRSIANKTNEGAHEFLGLEHNVPVILIIGGSQGAQAINDVILRALPELLKSYQIIHQTGEANLQEVEQLASVIIGTSEFKTRYHPYPFLNELALRMSAGAADLVISRAGSTLFEIAAWGLPSIVIPISRDVTEHQSINAVAYAKTGAAVSIEQNNLSPTVLISEIRRILDNPDLYARMKQAAQAAGSVDAAKIIAKELLSIGLSHEN
jgi:UDP-N-acetylglucosamine--N-acetylmuramyl-(pentapeptide) pyrophosphoryl-undecaprenol N-acetylglucosamine transferase